MRTYAEWEADTSEPSLTDFLAPMEEVDEAIYMHMLTVVFPQYNERHPSGTGCLMQAGEAEYQRGGVDYYLTFQQVGGRYYYLGPLPEFKQA